MGQLMSTEPKSFLVYLICPVCGQKFNPDQIQTFCEKCQSPILARYNLTELKGQIHPKEIKSRKRGIWRWAELLPVRSRRNRITLGEGDTSLFQAPHLGEDLHLSNLYIKDESANPTGTFKARGLVMAVSRGVELGLREFVIPTAGNAGGALASYAARARCVAHVFMPSDAPVVNKREVRIMGADLHLVDGLIHEAGKIAADKAEKHEWFSVSTFKEPYRVEGKKTMGFEIAEGLQWELPDVIIYPTGGGTGLVGIWKAFEELEGLGWIGPERPRMVGVQSSGCAPIVRAFKKGWERAEIWKNAETIASGLRVPQVFADRLVLEALRESDGMAIAVTDEEIRENQQNMAKREGVFPAPEGAATLAALKRLLEQEWVTPDEKIVLLNTGTGLKYI